MATESDSHCIHLPRALWGTAWDGPAQRKVRIKYGYQLATCRARNHESCKCPGESCDPSQREDERDSQQ